MQLKLTQKALDWFNERNISFHNRFGIRLRPGDLIIFKDDLEVEPYIGIHGGITICAMGFMSYANCSVPMDLTVGRYCSLGPHIQFPRHRHPIEYLSSSIFTYEKNTDLVVRFIRDDKPDYKNFNPSHQKGPIIIGHDVWIGQGASIMPGVTIGTGAVVASNSVVTKSIMPYEIVGGNPAKTIKMRFSSELINELLLSEWWNYKFTDFDGLKVSSPNEFLKSFMKMRSSMDKYKPEMIRLADVECLCE